MEELSLTPTQRRVLEELMAAGRPRPSFPATLAERLRAVLEDGLSEAVAQVGPDGVLIRKSDLSRVHACEAHYLAEKASPFDGWSSRNARGTVAHKAIELSVNLRSPLAPVELVDLAIDRLIEEDWDWGPGRWLSEAPPAEAAELRSSAADVVQKFSDEFPPLKAAWRPRVESALSAVLCDGRVTLKGKVDLALGQARGTEAWVMIVDFKTGQPAAGHRDDLWYYALLETLRTGVPPFRVASWYLDSGHPQWDDVDEDVLEAAARRVVDGAAKVIELEAGAREARLRSGPSCGYCPARVACPGALEWAERQVELGVVPLDALDN